MVYRRLVDLVVRWRAALTQRFERVLGPKLAPARRQMLIKNLIRLSMAPTLKREAIESRLETQKRYVAAIAKCDIDQQVSEIPLGSGERRALRSDLSACNHVEIALRRIAKPRFRALLRALWTSASADAIDPAIQQPRRDAARALVAAFHSLDQHLVVALALDAGPALPDLDVVMARTGPVLTRLEVWREQFLALPGQEARVYLNRMLAAIGRNGLVGLGTVGAVGGVIALFGLAKAVLEQETTGLNLIPLMSAGDMASFGARLSVPYALLIGSVTAMAFFWTRTLEADHTGWRYERRLLSPVLILGFWAAAFEVWAPSLKEWQGADFARVIFITLAIVPALLLRLSLVLPGVGVEDVLQVRLLRWFRFLATTTLGLLTAFIGIGVALLATDRISVLFAHALGPFSIETKSGDAIPVEQRFVKLGDVWAFQATDGEDALAAAVPPTETMGDRDLGASNWFLMANSDLRCMTGVPSSKTGALDWRRCSHATPPKPGPSDPTAITRPYGGSIKGYARYRLGCTEESFTADRFAVITGFASGADKEVSEKALGWIPANELAQRGLQPVWDKSTAQGNFAHTLQKAKGTTWVLGFASRKGMPSANADLSKRRAERLREKLGLPPDAIARGLGEENPFVGGDEDADSQRIAVAFVCVEPQIAGTEATSR